MGECVSESGKNKMQSKSRHQTELDVKVYGTNDTCETGQMMDASIIQREILQTEQKLSKWLRIVGVTGTLCAVLAFLSYTLSAYKVVSDRVAGIPMIVAFLAFYLILFLWTRTQRAAAHSLLGCTDIHAVGPLADILEVRHHKTRSAIEAALVRLLPQLQATDADLLNQQQRRLLHRALLRKNADLILAVLKTLEQIGDSQALPYVEKLAAGKGKAAKNSYIQEAAQACLPYLKERIEEQHTNQTLLRSANQLSTSSEGLLRPATGADETSSEQLLRSSTKEQAQ